MWARRYCIPTQWKPSPSIRWRPCTQLVEDMDAGQVELLVILGGNPVYTAPADLRFAEQLAKVKLRVHLGLYEDETSALCHWHIPEAHALEAWSDARAYDGTVSLMQPLIAPLYGGKSAHELLAVLLGQLRPLRLSDRAGVLASQLPRGGLRTFWRTTLHDGVMADTALPPRTPTYRSASLLTTRSVDSCQRPSHRGSNSCFSLTRRCGMAASPIMAGCRNCPNPSPSSPGTTPPC